MHLCSFKEIERTNCSVEYVHEKYLDKTISQLSFAGVQRAEGAVQHAMAAGEGIRVV